MKRFILSLALVALLLGFSGPAHAASGNKKAAVASKAALQNPADYVGSEICATCHADVAKKFDSNPHSKLALTHGGTGATCESCHGGGKAHVESGGDITKIRQISKLPAKAVDETCLGCHAGTHPNFERSPHGKAGVGCTSCHSVHNAGEPAKLLKVTQSKLCFTCHTDVKPAFSQPFHHKVEEGLVKCSDCHDAHGTFEAKNLRSTSDRNAICTKCHTENAGPFAYEHPVVKTEGCVGCHSPHGSPNARLLSVSNINTLCLQCHSATNTSAFPHAISPSGPAHNQATQYVSCTSCHTQIHGSNASNVYFK
ncbi:MAG TPA: DmsE family decaheme c-type cytochrome [Acidobacteriaceae bacterium]|jgi:DmsE family decaheme c-type cytochrome